MAETLLLITGGCRSGKSEYARRWAESLPPSRLFIATCPVTDAEIERRIEAHRQARRNGGWETVEEQLDLAGVLLRHAHHRVILIDCITLWVNNLLYHASRDGRNVEETEQAGHCRRLLDAAASCRGTVLMVTNEVGMDVVPENPLARRYRDLVGRANQMLAARADAVTLVVCGIPWPLKGLARPAAAGEIPAQVPGLTVNNLSCEQPS